MRRWNDSYPLFALAFSASLSGCTTIGSQSVLRQPSRDSIIPLGWSVSEALEQFYTQPDRSKRRDIRDRVIGLYLSEEDARFIEYKDAIRIAFQQSNFLLDAFSIGLASAASVAAKKTANTLSAGAAAVAGTRASFNKNVYFEQTMNTIIAQMDAAHDRQSTNIRLRMQKEGPDSYSLTEFFDDLARLEGAGTVEKAMQQSATEAGQKAADEQARLEAEFVSGVPEEDAVVVRTELRQELAAVMSKAPPGRGKQLAAAAGAVGAKVFEKDDDTVRSIRERFLTVTSGTEARELQRKLRKALDDAAAAAPAAEPPPVGA